jgi:hypothetical protein
MNTPETQSGGSLTPVGSASLKYSVDWKNIETGEEGWTGILYPSRADAEWSARNLSGVNQNLEVRVETIESFL